MNGTAIAKINLSVLTQNLFEIRRRMPGKKILAMVKSNAYGHGLIPVGKTLSQSGIDGLGVATISEALLLREAGVKTDLVVMRGFATQDELSVFLSDPHLIACIHSVEQLSLLESASAISKTLRIWLKMETGMHRLGIPVECFDHTYQRLLKLDCVEKPFVLCTHLADADNADPAFTQKQIQLFEKLTRDITFPKSVLNSAGVLSYSGFAYDWIRPGLMLYGASPFSHQEKYDFRMKNLKPVMQLESKLIAIKKIKKGEKIGYCCTYTAEKDMTIGIIGMGYGDGYPRSAKNGTPILIRNQRCPIVGRVSMDMITVDISEIDNPKIDETVILWGEDLLVTEIAECAGTIAHELLCHLTGRVQTVLFS